MVGHVAAPVGPLELGADRDGVDQQVGRVGPQAERVHVRVLEQQEVVVGRPVAEAPLEDERVAVADGAQPPHPQRHTSS